jgi:tRNA A-37 threonylcarbamoyl transferase component Bud32/type II secretory pathway pseudopilin PulG
VSVAWVPKIGSEFGGYRLESLIGHGGMSIVYRARSLSLDRIVALKLLSPQLSDDEAFRERFLRESRMAAALDHPNVIPIFEAGEADGVFFIAMRYVDGLDLKTLLKREGPLPLDRTASIIGQVASALGAAHAKGLVHRDVKPANILIASGYGPEDDDHVYLSDFGVVKHGASRPLTQTGMFVGTAEYASPEQIEGKELDGRADVYALGCVLYECLTGDPAYDKDSEVALMYAHLLEPPPQAAEKRPDLPPAVDVVVAKGMAKQRDDRYDTPRDLAVALREAAGLVPGTSAGATQLAGAGETVLAAGAAGAPPPGAPPTTASVPPAGAPAQQAAQAPPPAAAGPPAAGGGMSGRAKLIAAIVAAVVVIGAAVAAVIVLTGGSDSNSSSGASDQTLLDVLVPTQIARTCTPTTVAKAIEAYTCTPAANAPEQVPNDLQIAFYSNAADKDAAYKAAINDSGAEQVNGKCTIKVFGGEGIWKHPDKKVGGSRFCYLTGESGIVWTHDKLGSPTHVDMVGVAREPGRGVQAGLYRWWASLRDFIGKCRANIDEASCTETVTRIA